MQKRAKSADASRDMSYPIAYTQTGFYPRTIEFAHYAIGMLMLDEI